MRFQAYTTDCSTVINPTFQLLQMLECLGCLGGGAESTTTTLLGATVEDKSLDVW